MKHLWAIALAAAVGASCATDTPPPRPADVVIKTKEVERIVRISCADKREPLADLPDDDEDLAMVDLMDPLAIFKLAQKYVAARPIYRARLKADDDQIAACAQQKE